MTLNDFEWLEWPFYITLSLLRTALSAISLYITVESVYVMCGCAEGIRRIFGIRGKTADLS